MVQVTGIELLVLFLATGVQGYPIKSNEMRILVSKLSDATNGDHHSSLNSLRNHARFSKHQYPHFSVFSENHDWTNTADGRNILQAVNSLSQQDHPLNRQVLLDHIHQSLDKLSGLLSHHDHSLRTNQVRNRAGKVKDFIHHKVKIHVKDENNHFQQYKMAGGGRQQNGHRNAYNNKHSVDYETKDKFGKSPYDLARNKFSGVGTEAKENMLPDKLRFGSHSVFDKSSENSETGLVHKVQKQVEPAPFEFGADILHKTGSDQGVSQKPLKHSIQHPKIHPIGAEKPYHSEVSLPDKISGNAQKLPTVAGATQEHFVIDGSYPQVADETEIAEAVPSFTELGSEHNGHDSWGDVVEPGQSQSYDYTWDAYPVEVQDQNGEKTLHSGSAGMWGDPIPVDTKGQKVRDNACAEATIGPCRTDSDCQFDVCQHYTFECVKASCVFIGMHDQHGEWMDQPFDVVESEQYIGPNDGEVVPEKVEDGAPLVADSFMDGAKHTALDWGFPDHETKPLEFADVEKIKDGQISGGHWAKKRKSN
ncbi:uncharacterized protein LOC135490589 [Lineus longissimus]|uniref:uncharacterized protein LOC135490589 n=1 Tax=Lineus longissimus TaxID=88925 RepID=UPI002B4F4E79